MTEKYTDHQPSGILRLTLKIIQIFLYILIQIIFIPFAVIGIIYTLYVEMIKSKKIGVSFSAIQSLQYRWLMHYFDTRKDFISVKFIRHFPCESHYGLWATMGALIISQRVFGYTTSLGKLVQQGEETMYSCAGIRVLTFDKIMQKYVDEVEQIVIPGAGFDLIAQRFTRGKEAKVFELDQAPTLGIKVETMRNAGIEHDWITYIPVDYSNESWIDKLFESGFDASKKTLIIWQSVSLYLEAETVKKTLREMAELVRNDGIIVQDFYSTAFMSGEISKIAQRNMRMIQKMGEPWHFSLDMSENPKAVVDSFLNECGLKMTEYIQFGEKLELEPFYCIAEAEKA